MSSSSRIIFFFLCTAILCACDPEGRKQCQWVLEPESRPLPGMTKGMIHVCARNRTSGKQDCRLQIPLAHAKAYDGKFFRYVDLKVDSPGIPRTVVQISTCKP